MVAFVIFWAAVFALFFFLLSVIFNALASVFNYAIQAAVAGMVPAIGVFSLPLILSFALALLYAIVNGIITSGFWSVVGTLFLIFILLGIVAALFESFGMVLLSLLQLIVSLTLLITEYVSVGLEWLAGRCESGYIKFLNVIIKRLDMC